jgi:hypothetical protein
MMDERGGEPVSEDRGGRGPAARAGPALLAAKHGGHPARHKEIAAITRPGTAVRARSGGAAPFTRPAPKPAGPAWIDTMRLAY